MGEGVCGGPQRCRRPVAAANIGIKTTALILKYTTQTSTWLYSNFKIKMNGAEFRSQEFDPPQRPVHPSPELPGL